MHRILFKILRNSFELTSKTFQVKEEIIRLYLVLFHTMIERFNPNMKDFFLFIKRKKKTNNSRSRKIRKCESTFPGIRMDAIKAW